MENLVELAEIENKNLKKRVEEFKIETSFFYKIRNLFELNGQIIPGEFYIILTLFQYCKRNFIFSHLNLLRGHFAEPGLVTRRSIEAVCQATIIRKEKNENIWVCGEGDMKDKEKFETVFKENKYRYCKNKKGLRDLYKLYSTFGHPNLISNIYRVKTIERKVQFNYFEAVGGADDLWMVRFLNHNIKTYLLILLEFSEIFDSQDLLNKDLIKEYIQEHEIYMEKYREKFNLDKGKLR